MGKGFPAREARREAPRTPQSALARPGELLNSRVYSSRGTPSSRPCPVCGDEVSILDYVIHYGGELHHFDCAPLLPEPA